MYILVIVVKLNFTIENIYEKMKIVVSFASSTVFYANCNSRESRLFITQGRAPARPQPSDFTLLQPSDFSLLHSDPAIINNSEASYLEIFHDLLEFILEKKIRHLHGL